jgi:glutamine synthetase
MDLTALAAKGIHALAVTWVDNAGVTRMKGVPTRQLAAAAKWGVGMSPVFDVFCFDDSMTTSRYIGGPVGDLRLRLDLARLTLLAGQPGWAWAPADRWTQEGEPHPGCQRTFAKKVVEQAGELTFKMAFEVEWFVSKLDGTPGCRGPAYGMTRVVELSDYLTDLLAALSAQEISVEQLHPEAGPGQLELSIAPEDPVGAADTNVLVRQTIRAISQRHGLEVSFAPVMVPDGIPVATSSRAGNGMHLHLSALADGRNLFVGGSGPHGLTEAGEALLAGLLDRLPALVAIGAPTAASHLRLVPQRWAGPYQCWGRENREAALRFITGPVGAESKAANVELKCFDPSANPYLVVGAVVAVASHAVRDLAGRLPAEVTVDPYILSNPPPRLPQSVDAALAALAADDVLPPALGPELYEAFVAVRRAEDEVFAGRSPEEIAEATRWVY